MANAESLYNLDVNNEPSPISPVDPYKRIYANPEAFAAPGRALEQVGGEVQQLGNVWGKVQADSTAMDATSKLEQLTSHVESLQGQDALDAQKTYANDANQILQEGRSGLSLDQRFQYDSIVRPYQRMSWSRTMSHFDQQGKVVAGGVNKAGIENAFTAAGQGAVSGISGGVDGINAAIAPFMSQVSGPGGWAEKQAQTTYGMNPPAEIMQQEKQRFASGLLKTATESIETKDPALAFKFLESREKDMLPQDYQPVHDRLQKRAWTESGQQAGMDELAKAKLQIQGGSQYAGVGGADPTTALIQQREGLITSAKYDVNHYRVGYGSDTITKPDGTVEAVTKDTRITPEDAQRDLQRRIGETQGGIISQVGPQAWGQLNPTQRAALTSMAYNYGTLPWGVTAAVRGGGGPQTIANAILAHSGDNGGVNAQRRQQEASLMAGGHFTGVPDIARTAGAQTAGGSYAAPGSPPPALAGEGVLPTSAAYTPVQAEGGEGQPQQPAPMSPEVATAVSRATAINNLMNNPSLNLEQKEAGIRAIGVALQADAIMANATKKDEEDRKKKGVQSIWNAFGRSPAAAFDAAGQALQNGSIDDQTYWTQLQLIEHRSGQEDPHSVGPDFTKLYSGILSGQITTRDIDEAELSNYKDPNVGITSKGSEHLHRVQAGLAKPEMGYSTQNQGRWLKYAENKLDKSFSVPGTSFSLKDPDGPKYNAQFGTLYTAAAAAAQEKNPTLTGWEGFTQKHVDDLINQVRPPWKAEREQLFETTKEQGEPKGPAPEAIPPPSEEIDRNSWTDAVGNPAVNRDGTRLSTDRWAAAMTKLWNNPDKETMQNFTLAFPNQDPAALLQWLGGGKPRQAPPPAAPSARPPAAPPAQQQNYLIPPAGPFPGLTKSLF